ncbi:importin-13-like [Limulus polyphemus]|uniref:Importin-13 n=1 Tax=Limulus polyphemus TaxID=6850 RepID=A0ABM1B7W1_LIMPO|nr:importin-13-like [Limulus polyphemus]
MEYSSDVIERNLHQFYQGGQNQQQTNHFLTQAQISPQAWFFAWDLLDASKSHVIQFFGASTLHVKISKFFHELPTNQYEPLRNKLLEAILSYSGGPKIVLTQLCVALSAYIIHTVSDHWPTAIADVAATVQPSHLPSLPPQQVMLILLELLTVLPEEFQTAHLAHSQKGIIRNALQSSLHQVSELLLEVLSQPLTSSFVDLHQMGLKCYSSWSQLGPLLLEYESLFRLSLSAVYNEELCQTALEALSNVVTHPEAYRYPNLILKLLNSVIQLEDLLNKSLEEKDMDVSCSIYGLFISFGEHHTKLLLDTLIEKPEFRNTIMKLIELIKQASATPGHYPVDELCSEQTFGFWYTLQDDIVASEPPQFEALLVTFNPVFHSLVDTYLLKVQYPPDDLYSHWLDDEKESFRCYRQDIGDSFMYCYNILREAMLANLLGHLELALDKASKDVTQWQHLEASLFAFQSVAESVAFEEQHYLPKFFNFLPKVPFDHIRIFSAVMDAVGAYAEWINVHPQVLGDVVPLLLLGLQNPKVAPASTMALKDITRDCQACLKPFSEQILKYSQEALSANKLKSREQVRLMNTIGQVLSMMPINFILSYLDPVLTPMLQQLEHALTQQPTAVTKFIIIHNLNMLSMLFASLDTRLRGLEGENSAEKQKQVSSTLGETHPVLLVTQKIMPVFNTVATVVAQDEQVAEALCDALKRAVLTLLEESSPIVEDILQLILRLYQTHPYTAALDVTKQILLLFSQDQNLKQPLSLFLVQICNHTLALCQADLREHTSLLEIFYQTLSQLIKKALSFFEVEGLDLSALFQCSVAAIGLPEKPTVKSSSSFLAEFINCSREVPALLNVVNNNGESLVVQVLRIIGGESPRHVVEYMSDILMALNKKYFDNLCRWMSTYLHQQGFPSHRVSTEQKENFVRLILKERSNKRKLKETVNEFTLLCRGLIGTEYAAQVPVFS